MQTLPNENYLSFPSTPRWVRHSYLSKRATIDPLYFWVIKVVFGSPDNFRSEDLIFDIVPFRSGYHALLGRTAFACFNLVPHYAYLKLKMSGPRGFITFNGNMERSLHTEEHTATLAGKVQSGPVKPHTSSAIKPPDNVKRVRSTLHDDSSATLELD